MSERSIAKGELEIELNSLINQARQLMLEKGDHSNLVSKFELLLKELQSRSLIPFREQYKINNIKKNALLKFLFNLKISNKNFIGRIEVL